MLRRRRIGASWPDSTRAAALQAAERIPIWTEGVDAELLQRFVPIIGIDDGEALLFAVLARRPSLLMITGDKRSMTELCATPTSQGVVPSFTMPR